MMPTMRERILNFLNGNDRHAAKETLGAAARAVVDDSRGWTSLTGSGRPHERDWSEVQGLYEDSLSAYRKNPIAWRIIATTTNYVVGDRLQISSSRRELNRFIRQFWEHPKNRMHLRLAAMSDELARAGDLFVVLFRNPADGMSYLRFVTKDRIVRIETAPNDWETELCYYERSENGSERKWYAAGHPESAGQDAIMLHYAANRPIGALLGESDLASMLPWLARYSRMLEDRVRLHWAVRAFLWIVTVPTNKIAEKQVQYRNPPEAGSIIIKDESERWEVAAPNLHGSDASHDLRAVRQMVDAGSGYPPHWRGEAADANLATATAMQAPTERALARRQQYFAFMLQDILWVAYQRAVEAGKARPVNAGSYAELFTVTAPDVSRSDNEALARAAKDITQAFATLYSLLEGRSPQMDGLLLRLALRFAGEPQPEETIAAILQEAALTGRAAPAGGVGGDKAASGEQP
jgi:hypothetical protein